MLTKQFDDVLPAFGYARVPEAAMPKLVYCGVSSLKFPSFFNCPAASLVSTGSNT
jgi:hypothetical protein